MKKIEIKVIGGATYFALVSRRVRDIAAAFGVHDRTVHRWSEHPLWHTTLDVLDYAGLRSFEKQPSRDVAREQEGVFEMARDMYQNALATGIARHELTDFVAEHTGVPQRKIRDWARRYQWRGVEK